MHHTFSRVVATRCLREASVVCQFLKKTLAAVRNAYNAATRSHIVLYWGDHFLLLDKLFLVQY